MDEYAELVPEPDRMDEAEIWEYYHDGGNGGADD